MPPTGGLPPPDGPAPPPGGQTGHRRRRLFGGLVDHARRIGHDVASVVLGKLLESPPVDVAPLSSESAAAGSTSSESSDRRVHMLHDVAERLRGVADSYIAAKLDEIEARVDAKLDHVEDRIDAKITDLHRQLQELRDREVRHRLRLLKITLIFTVLVALLSLGYKWFARTWST